MTELPQATLLWAGLLGLLMAFLSIRVPLRRRALQVSLGDGGDGDLLARIRAFGNFIEYVPMILLLLLMIELSGGATAFIHACGALLFAARLSHGLMLTAGAMTRPQRMARMFGSGMTFLVLTMSSVYVIALFF
ncbi:MAPEG family protein [Parvularcula lutaonensis]|uniref:MAPEG family protein n=1 Tax=Parvularcula lutaonensis TaxID=491923 RepID=A0ABV7M9R5_9PROT|nr:MAPEG family protein [Parvularcula lutaonensis]GGY43108.1 hypothetical protein GCM10007148_09770 [Parvularcula lutaonensis]